MARFLFKVDKKKTVILDEDAVRLCPELGKLNSKQMMLVILYVDYASPYHQLPEKERMLRAKRHVYGTSEGRQEKEKAVIDAMVLYQSLQYDNQRETLRNYREKITRLSQDILEEKDVRLIGKTDEAIEVLQKRATQIEKELNELDMNQLQLKGNQRLSLIEVMQSNQREFNKSRQREARVEDPSL